MVFSIFSVRFDVQISRQISKKSLPMGCIHRCVGEERVSIGGGVGVVPIGVVIKALLGEGVLQGR